MYTKSNKEIYRFRFLKSTSNEVIITIRNQHNKILGSLLKYQKDSQRIEKNGKYYPSKIDQHFK